jgi:Oligosaccharyltransferase subunit Ribophorin II
VNLKGFPSSAAPAAFALLFHGGIGAVLLLYVLFWLKVFFSFNASTSIMNLSLDDDLWAVLFYLPDLEVLINWFSLQN